MSTSRLVKHIMHLDALCGASDSTLAKAASEKIDARIKLKLENYNQTVWVSPIPLMTSHVFLVPGDLQHCAERRDSCER